MRRFEVLTHPERGPMPYDHGTEAWLDPWSCVRTLNGLHAVSQAVVPPALSGLYVLRYSCGCVATTFDAAPIAEVALLLAAPLLAFGEGEDRVDTVIGLVADFTNWTVGPHDRRISVVCGRHTFDIVAA